MAGEAIVKWGTQKTLEANGTGFGNGGIVQADDASYDLVADGASYPDAEFVLACTFSAAPTESTVISLVARPLNIDGTNDADAPDFQRQVQFIGNFIVNNVTTTQYLWLMGYDLPREADYYLANNAGQSIAAGWTLKVTPRTLGPA